MSGKVRKEDKGEGKSERPKGGREEKLKREKEKEKERKETAS